MSDVPHVAITQSPAHFLKRLITCMYGRASKRFASVMLVRSEIIALIFFVTCGLTESTVCGVSFSASSEPEARVFVACFFLQTLMTMSSPFGLLPTIMPS